MVTVSTSVTSWSGLRTRELCLKCQASVFARIGHQHSIGMRLCKSNPNVGRVPALQPYSDYNCNESFVDQAIMSMAAVPFFPEPAKPMHDAPRNILDFSTKARSCRLDAVDTLSEHGNGDTALATPLWHAVPVVAPSMQPAPSQPARLTSYG